MAPQVSQTSSPPVPPPTFTPALKPPTGITSNPDHPASLAYLADITIAVCLPLVTVFFLLRTYARVFIKRQWILEDSLVTIAWAGVVAYCGILRATMSHHGGQHSWDITADEAHEASYWFNVASIEYGVMIGVTKCAVLCFYRRFFSPVRWSKFDITIVALIFMMVSFYGSITIAKIFECTPREKIWNNSIPGDCIQVHMILNVSGGFNTVTDYLILLLPVQAVSKLQMDGTKRILVVLAFTFGLCAPIFATVGFVVRLKHSSNPDTSWNQPDILLWGTAELTSGNLCVCFPEIVVLFRPKLRKGSGPRPLIGSHFQCHNPAEARPPKDPYFSKSLMSTMFSTTGDEQYIEFQDKGNDVKITPTGTFPRAGTLKDGIVILQNEVKVEHQERP